MYKREYDALLEKKSIPKSVLFYGECDYLVSLYAKKSALCVGGEDEIKKIYFGEYEFAYCKELLGTHSLFGDKNIMLIKSDKRFKKEELSTLLELASKNGSSYLFVEFYGENSDAKVMATQFSKEFQAENVRFFEPTPNEAVGIITQKAKEIGVELSSQDMLEIYKIQEGNLALAVNELEKLAIGLQGGAKIEELVSGLSAQKTDELFFELLEKKDVKAKFLLLLQEGTQEIDMINGLLNFLYRVSLFRMYVKSYGAPNAQEIFGYTPPKHLLERVSALSFRLKEQDIRELFGLLFETQLKLKSDSAAAKEAICLSALIRVQALLQ